MVKIPHSFHFVTEVDETHPTGMRLLALNESMRTLMLESMLKDLLGSYLQPEIDRLNEKGSYAILKVAE